MPTNLSTFLGTTFQGNTGIQGAQGIQGLSNQGVQGTQGVQGRIGAQGTAGAQGVQGVQGFSPVGIPSSTNTTLVAADAGKFTIINGNVTINASTGFATGNMCTIYNSGTTTRTITATGVTLRWAGTSTTGNRFLSQKGLGNILCVASNDYVISGAGLT
jgi:hypothetical protein